MSTDPDTKDTSATAADSQSAADTGAAQTIENPKPSDRAQRALTPAARRALAEAEARRKAHDEQVHQAEKELGGRGGADPARYGDWEINGRAIDF